MLTFLEFYEVLVGFVNFKLFHALGMKYPPQLDVQKDELGETFRSIIAESITPSTAATNNKSGNAKASEQLKKKSEQRLASLNEALTKIAAKADAPEPSVNVNEDTDVFDDETEKLKLEAEVYGKLFDGCVVFLSREVRYYFGSLLDKRDLLTIHTLFRSPASTWSLLFAALEGKSATTTALFLKTRLKSPIRSLTEERSPPTELLRENMCSPNTFSIVSMYALVISASQQFRL
jgi:hypothetical protein